MQTYLLLKTLHIVSATVLFGTGLGTAFHFWRTHRSGDVAAIAVSARTTVLADLLFTLPAIVIQPITGVALALMAGYSLTAPWLLASVGLYLVAGACWLPVVAIQLRLRTIAEGCMRDASALPPSFHRLMRAWTLLGIPAFASLVAVFWLMVAKPG